MAKRKPGPLPQSDVPSEVLGARTDPIPQTMYFGDAWACDEPYNDEEIEQLLVNETEDPKLRNALQELLSWRAKGRGVRDALMGVTHMWDDAAEVELLPDEVLQIVLPKPVERRLQIQVKDTATLIISGAL